MGFKSILGKIGKIALTAAPYVAAPFTGGLSLGATGLANKAVNKWSEHDAKNAIAKGLEPSSFDKILSKVGKIGDYASAVVPTSALGKIGMLGKAGDALKTASKLSKAGSIIGKVQKGIDVARPIIGSVRDDGQNYDDSVQEYNPGIGPSNPPVMNLQAPPPQQYDTMNAIERGRQRARQQVAY